MEKCHPGCVTQGVDWPPEAEDRAGEDGRWVEAGADEPGGWRREFGGKSALFARVLGGRGSEIAMLEPSPCRVPCPRSVFGVPCTLQPK